MKKEILIITSLFLLGLPVLIFAQNISNVQVEYSCATGKTTITYDLITTQPIDIALYYSHNAQDWLLAETVTGDLTAQSAGTGKTIIWDNIADNVRFGMFYFKIEFPMPDRVWINGVCWATRNVDMPGTFAANPEDAGMFYQWNRNIGWSSTNPMINSNGGTTWDSSMSTGTIWEKANDPSPAGWRVPTLTEIQTLLDDSKVNYEWTTINGVNGMKFIDRITNNTLFFPAIGYRLYDSGWLSAIGLYGNCWSNTHGDNNNNACTLNFYSVDFYSNNVDWGGGDRRYGFSVRAVTECLNLNLDLNISYPLLAESTLNDTICQGDSYYKYGFALPSQDVSGIHTYRRVYGCDSIVTLHLMVSPLHDTTFIARIPVNQPYSANGFFLQPQAEPGFFTLEQKFHSSYGCDSILTLYLTVYMEEIIPDDFFTPNGDGINDVWNIRNIEYFEVVSVEIFDRLGKRLRRWDNEFPGWDGTYLGKPMPSTDYWYIITLKEVAKPYVGHFTLIR